MFAVSVTTTAWRFAQRGACPRSPRFHGDNRAGASQRAPSVLMLFVFYVVVITLGILSMGFQLLASRLLNPHFGSSIIVWAWLISTFLAAFSAGSMLGGWNSNRAPDARRRGQWAGALIAVASLALTTFAGRSLLDRIEVAFPEMSTALLVSCV